MRAAIIIMLAAAVGLLAACASRPPEATHYAFSFHYLGDSYEIISVVEDDDSGRNYLTQRDGTQLLMSAKDEDQNGTIDTVLFGALTLDEAAAAYQSGIEQAQLAGLYRNSAGGRVYVESIGGERFTITSVPEKDGFANLMSFIDAEGVEVVLIDYEADGQLDRVRKGDGDLASAQNVYSILLAEGVKAGQIGFADDRYVVEPVR